MPAPNLGNPTSADFEFSRKLTTGYMAFVAALSVAILAIGKDSYPWTRIFPLLMVSLPSLVAALILESRRAGALAPGASSWLGFAYAFGLLPSLYGITLLVSHFCTIAGVIFPILCIFWAEVLRRIGRGARGGG